MVDQTLFAQVRRKLNITWEDTDTTARIEEIIEAAMPDLIYKLGVPADFDFSVAGMENTLFLSYCLYEWNHTLDMFDSNYARMIAQVRAKHEVEYFLKDSESNAED